MKKIHKLQYKLLCKKYNNVDYVNGCYFNHLILARYIVVLIIN